MITNLNIDLTTRYCPVEYKGQQWVKLYYTPRDEMKLYRVMKRKEVCTNIYIWADNPEKAKIKATVGPTEKVRDKEGFEKIEYVWIDYPEVEIEEIENETN